MAGSEWILISGLVFIGAVYAGWIWYAIRVEHHHHHRKGATRK